MTIDEFPESTIDAADRRGADTHWWNAYRLHSMAPPAAKADGTPASPVADPEAFSPTRTEVQRAASKALGSS